MILLQIAFKKKARRARRACHGQGISSGPITFYREILLTIGGRKTSEFRGVRLSTLFEWSIRSSLFSAMTGKNKQTRHRKRDDRAI